MKITFKLVLFFCVCIGIVYTVSSTYVMNSTREIMMEDARLDAEGLLELVAGQVSGQQRAIEELLEGASIYFRDKDANYYDILKEIVSRKNGNVVGSTFAYNTSYFSPKSPYYMRKGDVLDSKDLAQEYDYWNQEWYTEPMKKQEGHWSEPYTDFGIFMITYSKPVMDNMGRIKGILTADVSLEQMGGFMKRMGGDKGFAFIISNNNGRIISSHNQLGNSNEDLPLIHEYYKPIISIWNKAGVSSNKTGIFKQLYYDTVRDKNYYVVFSRLETANWSAGVVFEEVEVLNKVNGVVRESWISFLIGLVIILVVIFFLARSITKPLRSLTHAAQNIGRGALDEKINVDFDGRDEISILGQTLHDMQDNLKKYVAMLETTTAQKQKIESELRIAHDMQQSMLPSTNSLNQSSFDIYASLKPAKEVGGDLYDFFMIDSQHICLIIGDVSDKGVPAALFMAITDTYAKAFSRENFSPASILTETNRQLCETNEMCMFVSVFCCVINLKTGECSYSNAGHNPPFIVSANGDILKLQTQVQPVLGVYPDKVYSEGKMTFLHSEIFVMYTDGITEAMDGAYVEFGEQRLLETITNSVKTNCKKLGDDIMSEVEEFTLGAMPSDDRTLLVFQLNYNND